ncbi:magnesium-translocating P-type ATPase [Candidatus Gottesmanbacteria bacterium]|nr:magnesium-translocating P-type ATPase [Candidatus Gottesmanbacteria bacterium]
MATSSKGRVDAWWAVPLGDIYTSLTSSREGLSQEEADRRRAKFGLNVLSQQKKYSLLERFLIKLANPLILLLLAAAFISAAFGQVSDFFIYIIIIFVSMSLDVYQEHQAVEGAERLRRRVSVTAGVIRDGVKREMPVSLVVPGDIVLLSVGDIVPADCRVVEAKDFLVDQSSLTGESFPQEKDPGAALAQSAIVSARTNCVFMGTNVITGEATALVVATGSQTELGHVATALVSPRTKTEFEKGLSEFGLLLTKTALVVSVLVFASHVLLHHDFLTSMLFVLALAIGFAPELLPVILTINLSKGAMRMSAKGVIVKSLPSIENFGSIEILATDKTGTLTENAIVLAGHPGVTGHDDDTVLLLSYVSSKYQSGFKGPMEQAILSHKNVDTSGYRYLETIPFDFFRKRVSVIVEHEGKKLLIVKGAPEEILPISTSYDDSGKTKVFTPAVHKKVRAAFETFSRDGLRALAVAYRQVGESHAAHPSEERDLTFLGFLTFLDPPKKTVIESVGLLAGAGIEVKVVTGDNELVTEKICRELKIPIRGIVRGEELDHLTDHELGRKALETTIFARLNPDQKKRLMGAVRKAGKVVGYLGDGINDAPSLRAADIGISVNNAADVAKESADIILLHKSLHVLYEGVMEGRKTFANVMKYLNMGLSANFGNMFSIAVASLFFPFLPLLPRARPIA